MMLLAELLRPSRRAGFPLDYLLARLAGRRARRLESCPVGSTEEARRELDQELDWFHEQLEPELRQQLAPVLLFFELPALLAALRHSEAGDQRAIPASLKQSRLSPKIRDILTQDSSSVEILKKLGEHLAPLAGSLAGLAKIRQERGRNGLEQALGAGLLAAARREQPTGPIRAFIDQLAERQELLRLAKATRWPGQIPTQDLPRDLAHRHRARLARRQETRAEPAALDHQLLTDLARYWRRRRTTGRLEQLLDYLWTCYLAARDCGVRCLAELLGEERVARETILPG